MADSLDVTPRLLLGLVGVATAVVLIVAVSGQIYDSNFLLLSDATALLAGDRPYRDFYQWGSPLSAYLSAGMQWLVGYRLIGEFLISWTFIVAGVVVSFRLGLQRSRTIAASVMVMPALLMVIAYTPTYHYSKLFFFPIATWLSWKYLAQPNPTRGAVLGCTTAIAFLFRHDYGAYIGFASMVAFAFARFHVAASRRAASMVKDVFAYAVAVVVIVTPWAVFVQFNEGLSEYFRMRAALYQGLQGDLLGALLVRMNPVMMVEAWFRDVSAPDMAVLWLQQVSLLVPLCLLMSAG